MKPIRDKGYDILRPVVLIVFLLTILLAGPSRIFMMATAENKEYEVDKFDENITISTNTIKAIDIDIQKGEEIEVVYTLQVREALPVDVWFVNEDHYKLLLGSAQFLYYIDGSEQEVQYARKILSLTEPDLYKLVISNYYNNKSVIVNLIYEIRTYNTDSSDSASNDLSMYVLPLSLTTIVLVAVLLFLLIKPGKQEDIRKKSLKKTSVKKKKLRKSKREGSKPQDKTPSKEPNTLESNKIKPKLTSKAITSYCGHCGISVTTLFCTNCGRKVRDS